MSSKDSKKLDKNQIDSGTEEPIKEPRGARRKKKTRQKLLDAALILMGSKGFEGVAINEITEEADVGFGSFYNHFESKESLYETLQDEAFKKIGDAVDAQLENLDDPAEKISVALRQIILYAKQNPDWAKFLIRQGASDKSIVSGAGLRLARDVDEGIKSKRFQKGDLMIQLLSIGGTVLACLSSQLALSNTESATYKLMLMNNERIDNIGERLAQHVLINFGIDKKEAEKIVSMPLPTELNAD